MSTDVTSQRNHGRQSQYIQWFRENPDVGYPNAARILGISRMHAWRLSKRVAEEQGREHLPAVKPSFRLEISEPSPEKLVDHKAKLRLKALAKIEVLRPLVAVDTLVVLQAVLLSKVSLSTPQLMALTGIERKKLGVILHRLVNAGHIRREARGVFSRSL